MARGKRKRKKRISRFTKGFLIYAELMLIVIMGLLIALWISLQHFQAGVDDSVELPSLGAETVNQDDLALAATSVFEAYMDTLDASAWVDLWFATYPDSFDSRETVGEFLTERILSVDCSYYEMPGFDMDQPEFVICAEQEPLARVRLAREGNDYRIDNATICLSGEKQCEVQIPKQSKLLFNGKEVPYDDSKEMDQALSVMDYEEQLINPVMYTTYQVSGLLAEPEIEVVGNTCEVQKTQDNVYYELADESVQSGCQQKARNFINALLVYYAQGKENTDENLSAVLGCVASGSKASEVISASKSGVIWRAADYGVSYNLEASPVYRVADNCVCVDVIYTVTNAGKNYEWEDGIYRIYFLDQGNGLKIVKFEGI